MPLLCLWTYPRWPEHLSTPHTDAFAERALALLARKDLDFDSWMFGVLDKQDGEFPYQCSYSLGYALVKAWLAHAGATAAKAYSVDAEVVANAWRSGAIKPA